MRLCTGVVRTPQESALNVDLGEKKNLCRTGESNLRRERAGPMLYHLSYIPTHPHHVIIATNCGRAERGSRPSRDG